MMVQGVNNRRNDRIKSGVCIYYNEIEGVAMFVCRKKNMLYEIGAI